MDRIAIIMNNLSMINSFKNGATIAVFANQGAFWSISKRIPVNIDFSQDLFQLREDIRKLIAELDNCRIIAGKTISGLAYHMFDKMGFDIFEVEQFSPEILDQILSDVKNISAKNTNVTSPVETDVPGIYFLDLIALQQQNPDISSKMVLQPFLSGTPFLRLDIICRHLPPWIETFITKAGMKMTTEQTIDGKVQVHITKAYC